MDSQVLGERAAVGEGLLAGGAAVGSFAGVGAHVRGDAGALRESPVADGTSERLLASVCAYMGRQVGGLGEALVAVGASIGSFAGVGPQMGLERAGSGVCLAAEPAQIGFHLATTAALVSVQILVAVLLIFEGGETQAQGRCLVVATRTLVWRRVSLIAHTRGIVATQGRVGRRRWRLLLTHRQRWQGTQARGSWRSEICRKGVRGRGGIVTGTQERWIEYINSRRCCCRRGGVARWRPVHL